MAILGLPRALPTLVDAWLGCARGLGLYQRLPKGLIGSGKKGRNTILP